MMLFRKEEEREIVFDALEEGVLSVDHKMRVRSLNYAAARLLGVSKRQLIGRDLRDFQERANQPLLQKAKEVLLEALKRKSPLTDSFKHTESRKIYFDLISIPKKRGKGAVLIIQDKSQDHRVLELGRDFISNASHELRTPVTIIKGFAETLQDIPELPKEMVADITAKIVRSCQRMDNLIKSLLTLADIENLPSTRFRQCDLYALLENCSELIRAAYPDAQIEMEKKHVNVLADPDILELALMNLLENGIKYSNPPARIHITLKQGDKEGKLSISDRGIGIPASALEHIFDRFYTVDKAHSRRLGGAGLGLSIVKTIVEKHDGTIAVSSELGKGTTFTLTLPLR